ncbi:sugar ABC transporter permease [Pseudonocardia alni]|uniref:sugar ABC transporter permease n=1 Tax=Pseudonocardia alni TaxID=33907 RepID=UPI0033DD211B
MTTTTESATGAAPDTARRDPRTLLHYSRTAEATTMRMLALVAVIVLVAVVFNVVTDGVFISPRNLTNLSVQVSVTALVSIGVTWLLIARQIDLSSGALIALIAVLIAQSEVVHQWPFAAAVGIALGLGLVCGLVNGLLVAKWGIPAFIVTLGAFSYLRGAAYLVSDGNTVAGFGPTMFALGNDGVPPLLSVLLVLLVTGAGVALTVRRLAAERARGGIRLSTALSLVAILFAGAVATWVFGSYQGVPWAVVIAGVAIAVAILVSTQTPFGRHLYAVGGNPASARRAGIDITRLMIILFVVAGLLTAIGALVQAARLDSGPPTTANLMELSAISAAVVGGTSLFGGKGTIGGSMLGAVLMAAIANGLSLAGVNTFWQLVATGVLLVVAVATDRRARKESAL